MKRINIKVKGERLKVKGFFIFCLLSIFNFQFSICQAQNDSVLHRSVTVERDFQPVIQAAGKISTKPAVMETTIDPTPVEYSDYTSPVTPGISFNPLLSQPTRFDAQPPYNGYLRAALGHPNSLFDFGYHLDDGKNSILDVYAHHKAEWGLATLSKSKLGLDFTHTYSTCDLFFGFNGGNIYYHKYGHWYDYTLAEPVNMWEKNKVLYANRMPVTDADRTSLWTAQAFFGVKANAKQDVQYRVQTGYNLFSKPGAVSEHQIRTHASFDWHSDAHHIGAVLNVQNNFLQLGSLAAAIPDSLSNSRHSFRLEPYYAYEGKRFRLHLGVNLDLNLGHGQNALSGVENLSFAPSPHVNMEAQIAKQWLTLYMDVIGFHGMGSLQEFMEENRYRRVPDGIKDHHACAYTPVDGEIGFHIRPHRDLLFELHGGYALMLNQTVLKADNLGDFDYFYANYSRGKVGGQMNYHFRDAVRINLYGDYYFWSGDTTVYDRANWQAGLRIDGKIDKHWSLYSDNRFEGSRLALAADGAHKLAPTIDLGLGVEYNMWVGKQAATSRQHSASSVLRPEPKPNLTLFFQLNNWLHRKNELYYGYRSQGINCLVGLTFRF